MKTKIVVVDDDMIVKDMLTAYFVPKGYELVLFSDAESALTESKILSNKWDVLISDQELPKLKGLDFIEEFRQIRPEIPIIFTTSIKSENISDEAIKNGACDFIIKPINLSQLHISIERALSISKMAGGATENVEEFFNLKVDNSLLPLEEVVKKYIEFAVVRNGGAKDRTAKEIGIDRKTLYRKMKKYENTVH